MFAVRRLVHINSFVHHVGRAAGESQLSFAFTVHDGKGMRSAIQYAGQLVKSTQIRAERCYSTESKSDSSDDEKTTRSAQPVEQPKIGKPNNDGSNNGNKVVLKHPVSPFSLFYRSVSGQLKKELGGKANTWMLKAKQMFDELPFHEKMKFYDDFQLQSEAFRVAKLKSTGAKQKKLTTMDRIQLAKRGLQRARNSFKRSQSRVRQRIPSPYAIYIADKLRGNRGRLVNLRTVALGLGSQYSSLDAATLDKYRQRAKELYDADRETLQKYKEWRAALEHEYETQLQNPDLSNNDDPATKEKRKRFRSIERYFRAEKRIQKLRTRLSFLRNKLEEELDSDATAKKNKTGSESASSKAARRKSTSSKKGTKGKGDSYKVTDSKTKAKAEKKTKKVEQTQQKQKQKRTRKKSAVKSDEDSNIEAT